MRCEDKMRTKWKNVNTVFRAISCLMKSNLALRSRLRLNYGDRNLRSRLNLRLRLRFGVEVKIKA
jgi:hypothetical protein